MDPQAPAHRRVACTGRDRCEVFASHVRVMVTDSMAPRFSRLQLTRALQETQPGPPMILLSGCIGAFTPEELRQGGVVRALRKPVASEGLATALRASLAGGSTP